MSAQRASTVILFLISVDIYDEDKDTAVDSTPVASAVATRATQMVELLSRDNVALREKLESVYLKMNNMQMVSNEKKHLYFIIRNCIISNMRSRSTCVAFLARDHHLEPEPSVQLVSGREPVGAKDLGTKWLRSEMNWVRQ